MATTRTKRTAEPNMFLVWAIVVSAWALTLGAFLSERTAILSHDAILGERRIPGLAAILLFVAGWQVMTAGMMLPSSLPMIRLFGQASRGQTHPRLALGAFLGGYFVIWTGFALVALLFDSGIHALVDRWAWLAGHEALITGSILVLAGAFQFSPLKEHCLRECRTPLSFLWRHYERGLRPAWALGLRHGFFCLGCCWALMLVMFAIGMSSLIWLTALTGVMVLEKTTRWGQRLIPYVGIALIGLGLMAVL